MTVIRDTTIPSSFQRLDTRVTAPDQFYNARDWRKVRENHNILLARRFPRPIAHWVVFNAYSPYRLNSFTGDIITDLPLLVTPGVKSLTINVYGVADVGLALYVGLYGIVSGHIEDGAVLPLGTAPAHYSAVLPVPSTDHLGNARLIIGIDGGLSGSAIYPGSAVVDMGRDWLLATLGGGVNAESQAIYSDTDAAFEPRMIIASQVIGANRKLTLDRNVNKSLVLGTDTVAVKAALGFGFCSFSLWENAITDFAAASEYE
ncbi:MAG TPA: hypothetical protein VJ787_05935 [Thermoleophilia bacterium]|nr:hypothetical protein [Thermoleophilia bacterium]